jgi:hypothetical protein
MFTPTLAFLQGVSANTIAGILTGSMAMLFTNNPTLGRSSVIADLVEPTFTGYARKAVTWGAAGEDTVGNVRNSSGLLVWQPSATTALPQTANGIAIMATISMTDTLLLAEYLPVGFNFVDVLSQLSAIATYLATNQAIWGDLTVVQV